MKIKARFLQIKVYSNLNSSNLLDGMEAGKGFNMISPQNQGSPATRDIVCR